MSEADILVFAPHPDDAEICCGGLLLKARQSGMSVAVVDVTRGEMGTRGSAAQRRREAQAASKLLDLAARENLGLPDGRLADDGRLRRAMVRMLRKYRPRLLLAPHWEDQHPDHAAVGQAAVYAAFLCGVAKYEPSSAEGVTAPDRLPYRPGQILHYNNRYGIAADIIVDISGVFERKLGLLRCYTSQFGSGRQDDGPRTRLSHPDFFDLMRGVHKHYGRQIGAAYGEAYCVKSPLRIQHASALL